MKRADEHTKVQFRLRITKGQDIAVGPGKIALLEAIAVTGSITAAAKSLQMSYRRGWLLVDTMNRSFSRLLVGRTTSNLRSCTVVGVALSIWIGTYGLIVSTAANAAPPPTIAAASDLQFALTEIAAQFLQATGNDVKLTFGSSGNFRQQIAQGAPFQLFMAADEAYVEALAAEGRTEDGGVRYATGRVALFVPPTSTLKADASLADLKLAVAAGRVTRFAIANPEHAPYGRAAREVLQGVGLWQALLPRLVLGENVSQAAQFAASGAAQGGIIAYSLAISPALADRGTAVLLPAAMHAPLHQRMVLLKGAGATARGFYAYLQQPPARATFKRFGFALPDE